MFRLKISLIFASVLLFCSSLVECKIELNSNGGYEDIVVSIANNIPASACPQLMQNIQKVLTSSSEYLFQGTQGRVYFSRVIVTVPEKWDSTVCGSSYPLTSFTSQGTEQQAAIKIGDKHPLFGDNFWTQQSRGCGLPGDFISVGYNTLLGFNETDNQENLETASLDRLLVKEWAKFRYGVFDEIGFQNDPIYPISYDDENGQKKATSCTNENIQGTWSGDCNNDIGSNEGQSSCSFEPSGSPGNDGITSSIMSFPQLKNVALFCDQNSHNVEAPTKQNFICEGKSIMEIINGHKDFRNLPNRDAVESLPPRPEFIIKQITKPRFVLLVEETGNMNLRDVWKYLKLAVRKLVKYDLAVGAEIGLISIGTQNIHILSNMTKLQSQMARRALADKLPNYPNVDSGGNIQLKRGIHTAIQMLKSSGGRLGGSVIILVSQGTVPSVDLESSLQLLKREDVSLAAIEYPSQGDGKLAWLAAGTNGPEFSIRETGVGPTSHMSTFIQLINAFQEIQGFYTKEISPNWPIMIHEAEYSGDSRSVVVSNFSISPLVAQFPVEFFIYTSNPNDPKINSVELKSPTGIRYTTQLSDLHYINAIKIDAIINEAGVWSYRMDRLADSHQSHFVQVVTKVSREDFSVRLYSNVAEGKVANLTENPIIVYVQVTNSLNSPVIDADVEAEITAGNKKWRVALLDNGNGDADLTGGDGVYSHYIQIPQGVRSTQLQISARVTLNPYRAKYIVNNSNTNKTVICCGSKVAPTDARNQLKIFPFGERQSNSLKIKISAIPPKGFYAPGRIGDLKLVAVDPESRNVSLEWTPPGEELDSSEAPSSYQIFYTSSLSKQTGDWVLLTQIDGNLNATNHPGDDDNTIQITLPTYGNFLLALRATNGDSSTQKQGKMSNIIKIKLLQPVTKKPTDLSTSSSSTSSGIPLSIHDKNSSAQFSKLDLLLIIICGVAFILLLSGLIVVLLYCRRVGHSHEKSGGVEKSAENNKISSIQISDPKSPIHWSASELLGEHEKGNGKMGQNEILNNLGHSGTEFNNIIITSDYEGTNSSIRSRRSPDSYDDPDSPVPIPVSVRNNPRLQQQQHHQDYVICVDNSALNLNSGYNNTLECPHYQVPQMYNLNGGPPGYNSGRFSIANNSNNSPLPPPPNNLQHYNYDPEVQGSLSSVNSKKRNITMV